MCSIKLGEVSESPLFFPGFDKLVHCGFFFVLIVFMAAGYSRQQLPPGMSYKAMLVILLAGIAYGGLIEILQKYFLTWRSGEWNDLFADMIGAAMAAFSTMITVKTLSHDKK